MIYRQTFTANLHDIDAAGVMFFAHYFRHAHDVYEAFMSEIDAGLPQLIEQRSMLPLVHSEADFRRPVRHGEKIEIILKLDRVGDTSFTVSYSFLNQQGEKAARLQTTHVMLNPVAQQPMSLPEALRSELMKYAV